MSSFLALCLTGVFVFWLLRRDVTERPETGRAIWIVVAWAVIVSSRPVTSWLDGTDFAFPSIASRDDGNPSEALVYAFLLVSGLMVVLRRGVRWSGVSEENAVLVLLYIFWLASAAWSDAPLITLKRFIKELGNVIMILVILTEKDPRQAVKGLFARCGYLCVPASILLIRYYPGLGRTYVGYSENDLMYVGVAMHKNTLGAVAMVAALFLLWEVLELLRQPQNIVAKRAALLPRVIVLSMSGYLLYLANSATSLVCALLGAFVLIAFSGARVKRATPRLQSYGVVVILLALVLDAVFNLKEIIVTSLGRDMSLTTRTDIWQGLLGSAENSLWGAGFNSFWAGSRFLQLQLAGAIGEMGEIIQAHNGYLETYLNGGWIAVGLLITLLYSTFRRIQNELTLGAPEALMRLVAFIVILVHNFSEASFNKMSLLWLVALFAIVRYHPKSRLRLEDGGALNRRRATGRQSLSPDTTR